MLSPYVRTKCRECFASHQDKTAKKINFDTFVEAVTLIAQKMNKSPDDVINIIVSAKGPT